MAPEAVNDNMKSYFKRKMPFLVLLSILMLFYLTIKVFVLYASALRVVEFAFLSVFLGLAPAYFFRKIFKFKNVIGWLVNSSVLGVLFIPFLFLFFGWIGYNIVFVYSVLFIYVCALLGVISLFFFADEDTLVKCLSLNSIGLADIFLYIILFAYTLILTLLNFDQIHASWDAFTFWGLDSKYIFQFNHLRDATLDVFGSFSYTSYYPIYYSIIYDLYGAVVEQYANWVNVFINLLALLLIYNNSPKRNFLQQVFVVTMLIVTSYGAINAVLMLSMYADTLAAFNMLLFMVVLTNDDEYLLEDYGKRTLLLLLLALSFYFIKTPFLFLTCALIVIWVIYDAFFLSKNWRGLIRRADFLCSIIIIIILYLMRFNYFAKILSARGDSPVHGLLLPDRSALYLYFVYAKELFAWLFETSPYLVGLWLMGLCSIFLIKKIEFNKRYAYIYLMSLFVFLFYCIFDILYRGSVYRGSLVRYTAVSMYLIPLMFGRLNVDLPRKIAYVQVIALFFVLSYFFIKTMTPMPLHRSFHLSTSAYNIFLSEYSKVAENALKISGSDARILIADYDNDTFFGNMLPPAIYVRYFLMNNSVGGQYFYIPKDDLYNYALRFKADYILLLYYDNSFDDCGNVMSIGQNYLIKIDENKNHKEKTCIFLKEDVFSLIRK